MKDYEISLFDDKELLKRYSDSTPPIIYFYSVEELILKLYDTKEKDCNIIYQLHEQEILLVTQNNDYITPDGYLYDARTIVMLNGDYTEKIDEEWNIHYTDTTVTDKRELDKEISKVNDLTYLSDKDTEIYLNIKAEELYNKNTRPNLYHFLFRPWYRFMNQYFLRLGFLDGKNGYVISLQTGNITYLKYSKLRKLYKNT